MTTGIGLSISRYENMTATPSEVVADILVATESAYMTASQKRQLPYGKVKKSRTCILVATHISEFLNGLSKGYDAETLDIDFEGIYHLVSIVRAPELTPEPIVGDATWQQFLPERGWLRRFNAGLKREIYPDILIGTPAEVAKIALGVGFSENQALAWNPPKMLETLS